MIDTRALRSEQQFGDVDSISRHLQASCRNTSTWVCDRDEIKSQLLCKTRKSKNSLLSSSMLPAISLDTLLAASKLPMHTMSLVSTPSGSCTNGALPVGKGCTGRIGPGGYLLGDKVVGTDSGGFLAGRPVEDKGPGGVVIGEIVPGKALGGFIIGDSIEGNAAGVLLIGGSGGGKASGIFLTGDRVEGTGRYLMGESVKGKAHGTFLIGESVGGNDPGKFCVGDFVGSKAPGAVFIGEPVGGSFAFMHWSGGCVRRCAEQNVANRTDCSIGRSLSGRYAADMLIVDDGKL